MFGVVFFFIIVPSSLLLLPSPLQDSKQKEHDMMYDTIGSIKKKQKKKVAARIRYTNPPLGFGFHRANSWVVVVAV